MTMTFWCLAALGVVWWTLPAVKPALAAPPPAPVQTVTVEVPSTVAAGAKAEASEIFLGPTPRAAASSGAKAWTGPPADYMKGVTVPELRVLAKEHNVKVEQLSRATKPVLLMSLWQAGVVRDRWHRG